MIARTRRIRLSNDIELETPVLVPALSSRALGPLEAEDKSGRKTELKPCSIVHSRFVLDGPVDSLLVSAYDISHGFLEESNRFCRGFIRSRYAKVNLLVIDSGGYEQNAGPHGGVFAEGLEAPLPWTRADYEAIVDKFDAKMDAVLVSWDYNGTYAEQIAWAQAFFGLRRRFASAILLMPPGTAKPSRRSRFHQLDRLSGYDVANLRAFDIVGVTEKDLGDTVLERMVRLAELRVRLDAADVTSPIHVFGALDPLYTPLYFAAGGEVFDGLGWLRYAFREGIAINREAVAILDEQVTRRWMAALQTVSLQNLEAMRNLSDDLSVFAQKGDWSRFGPRGEVLERVYESFEARLRKGAGGRYGR